jgi:hypothetical protein
MTDELKQRITKAVALRFEDNRTNKSLLIQLHGEAFFSQLCPTCLNAQIQAYIELYRLINPKTTPMPNPPSKKYRFNPIHIGAQVSIPARRWLITADTLTDEQAELMLKLGYWNEMNLIIPVEEVSDLTERKKAKKVK